ncbi:MAG: radical SAM family heme chaperone HemW [Deferribacterota bacterium]|nr:radical SAM family heme chaperone HemW [Deferribacterota bacterium]
MAGLYIHIPFCRKKCPYCDFISFSKYNENIINTYLSRLLLEIDYRLDNDFIDTIYIGGGTPSVIPLKIFQNFLANLQKKIGNNIVEFTAEVNPESFSKELLFLLIDYGVNRISMGVQSFEDDVLIFLGRLHSSRIAKKNIELIDKFFGLNRLNIDLMYNIPLVPPGKIFSTFKLTAMYNIPHISAYSYSVNNNYLDYFSDSFSEQMNNIIALLVKNNYEQYEISNFCKNSAISVHNIKYWLMDDYIGVGVGAHSMINCDGKRIRIANTGNLYKYMEDPINNKSIDVIKGSEMLKEDIIFGLRYLRGLNIEHYSKQSTFKPILCKIMNLVKEGYINYNKNNIKLSYKGILYNNYCSYKLWE